MANNLIQIKRTSIPGRAANTTTLPNPGELAINMTDGILYSGNGSFIFEIGANNTNVNVSGNLTVKSVVANGSVGGSGTVLTSDGNNVYWGPGAAGYTGSKGDLGFTGSKGDTGFTGSQGDVGYTGSTGAAGFTGSKGDTGSTGFTGSKGDTGTTGDTGFTGSFGATGFTGSQGNFGFTGSQGANGFDGSKGDVGYTGSSGNDGFTGSKGDAGFTGSQGTTGFTGSKGDQGPAGTFGGAAFEYIYSTSTSDSPTAGYVDFSNTSLNSANTLYIPFSDALGANSYSFLQTIDDSTSAIKGHFSMADKANNLNYAMFSIIGTHTQHADHFHVPISYLSGSTTFTDNANVVITFARTGDVGDQGPTGYTGSKGDIGYTGSLGATGFTGSRGSDGFIGSKGDTGFTGSQGNFGFTGSQGSTGFVGSQGNVGYTGSTGASGATGNTGFTGSVGYTGSSGTAGATGFTGSAGTNGTTGFTGSAGGTVTANAISQSFVANGTQTSFTLSTSVANQNNVIVAVNGLLQTPDAHYTITGTNLSFTFTPTVNDYITIRNLEQGTGITGGSGGVTTGKAIAMAIVFGG